MPIKKDFTVYQGETWQRVIRWESPPFIYKVISGITQAAPAVINAVAHGLTTGWRAAVVSVLGMTEINAQHTPPRDSDMNQVTVVDADHVSLNLVNATGFSTYASGGYLQFYTPVDMTGYTATMTIKDRVGGTVLLTLSSPSSGIVIDNNAKTITITMTSVQTEAFTWKSAVYDLDLVSPSAIETVLYIGKLNFESE